VNLYAFEKLREIEKEIADQRYGPYLDPEKPRRKPVFGALAAKAGRTLRHAGEGLESWANVPHAENDQPVQGPAS
jgi:hypothetical protein